MCIVFEKKKHFGTGTKLAIFLALKVIQFCFKNRKIQTQQDFLLIGNLYMKKQVSCGKELKHQSYYLFFKVQCEQVMN